MRIFLKLTCTMLKGNKCNFRFLYVFRTKDNKTVLKITKQENYNLLKFLKIKKIILN